MSDSTTDWDAACIQLEHYAITVKGQLDSRWSEWLEDLTVTHTESGDTILSGPITDQSASHGLLARIRDLNLALIVVNRVEIDQRGDQNVTGAKREPNTLSDG